MTVVGWYRLSLVDQEDAIIKEENKYKKKVKQKPTLIRLIAEIISDRDVGRAMSRQPTYYLKKINQWEILRQGK